MQVLPHSFAALCLQFHSRLDLQTMVHFGLDALFLDQVIITSICVPIEIEQSIWTNLDHHSVSLVM